MKVSIALCTFNGSRYLPVQLDSYLTQTRPPDELVVCDDRSTDQTAEVLDDFRRCAPFPVRIVVNEERLGYVENFIKAMLLCQEDLVALSDQDDWWVPSKLSRVTPYFDDPAVSAVMHAAHFVGPELEPTGRILQSIPAPIKVQPLDMPLWFNYQGLTVVFRRSLLEPHLRRPRPRSWYIKHDTASHDEFIVFLASILGTVVMLPDPLIMYRRHPTTATVFHANTSAFQRLRTKCQNVWQTRADDYDRFAALSSSRATFVEQTCSGADHASTATLEQVAARYRDFEATNRLRANVHRRVLGRRTRLANWFRLLRGGGYRSRYCGWMGTKAMMKDLVCTLLR